MTNEFHVALLKAIESDGDELKSIRAYIEVHIMLFMENIEFVRLYLAETRGASFNIRAGLDKELKKRHERILNELAKIFKRGIKKRLFKNFDPYLLATGLEGVTHALLSQYLDHFKREVFV